MTIDLYAVARPLIFCTDPEWAHRMTVKILAHVPLPKLGGADDPILATTVWGKTWSNPLGLAAGFDKNAEALAGLFKLGFGHVEAGSVTPRPQAGNPRPRVFRLPAQRAVINRYGMNNEGLDAFAARVAAWRARGGRGMLGVNISPNKDAVDGPRDYVTCIARLAPLADYLAMNVSSPNTPGLRGLQNRDALAALLAETRAARDAVGSAVPLLVKIAPDLTPAMAADIADVALASGIDGIIVTNTTTARPSGLPQRWADEAGGLSGAPLMAPATALLRRFYRLTAGKIPLIGVGGVMSGADAYAKIRAGASMVQLYSALIYEGPFLVRRMKRELATLLRRDGFSCVADAVGVGAHDDDEDLARVA